MRNLLSKLLSISLLTSGALATQNVSAQDIFAENKAATSANVSARSSEKKDAVQARKALTLILNRFREYSVSVEASSLDQDAISKELATSESAPSTSFKDYLDKMKGVLDKKLEGVTGNDENAMFQRARMKGGLNMLVSAKCLEGQEQNNFVQARDLDGNDLISFPIDSLRRGTRFGTVENYREGFARVKKDQVFGYLNLCGEEVITAQYSRAEPFNAGRAVVKRVEWYFVDAQGNESEAITGFTDVKALSRGVSAIKLPDGKFAFIDNNYDVSKKPISQSYDLIEPFYQNVVFKVRTGKKVGLLGLDGKTKLPVEYDNIEATKVAGVYKISINNMVGLIDTSWSIKLQPTYTSITDFNQFGLATAIHPKGTILVQKAHSKRQNRMKPSASSTSLG
ncbi:MAG: WG repeat-containing protein [Saprospiraceae bacterium]|nr:WG repeat-containing protein [Saprospiraceae bacterium]